MNQLHQFFAGYFHEDWASEASEPDGIIDIYIGQENNAENLNNLAALIENLVGRSQSEKELDDSLFGELGCYYVPAADGKSTRAWLEHVSSRLREAASETNTTN